MKKFSFLLSILTLVCLSFQTASAQDMTAKNKATIQIAYDALNSRDWATFASVCTPGYTDVNVGPMPAVGIDAALGLYKQFQVAFPDFMIKITEIIPASPTRFIVRVRVTGTNTGSFMNLPATGKAIAFDDVDIVEFDKAGKAMSHSITNTGEPLIQIGYGSMMNPATQIVMAAYEKFGKGDVPGILALCKDDVVFDIHDRIFDSKARMFKGKAHVGEFFQELNSKVQYSMFQPVRFVADGDDVFILVDVAFKQTATGADYTCTYTHHFKVTNGKISYFKGLDEFPVKK